MNRTNLNPKKVTHKFPIPFNGEAELFLNTGDEVTFDQPIFDVTKREIIESHFLPKLLSIKPENSADYVGRIAGEYIEKGDLLAEKLTAGGLIERRVVASSSGIVSLDRINQGYLDILGETIKESYRSIIEGKITGLSLGSHIEVEADSAAIPFTSGKNLNLAREEETSAIVGDLVIVKDGKSVYTIEDLRPSYEQKIVYAGRFAFPSLIKEIYLRGAYAVIVYSMNYSDLQSLKFPVVLLAGFGQLPINKDIEEFILQSVNHLVEIDDKTRHIYFANKEGIDPERFPGKKYFSGKLTPGDQVVSMSPDYKGIVGEVVEVIQQDGPDKVIIKAKNGGRLVMYDEMLENYFFRS